LYLAIDRFSLELSIHTVNISTVETKRKTTMSISVARRSTSVGRKKKKKVVEELDQIPFYERLYEDASALTEKKRNASMKSDLAPGARVPGTGNRKELAKWRGTQEKWMKSPMQLANSNRFGRVDIPTPGPGHNTALQPTFAEWRRTQAKADRGKASRRNPTPKDVRCFMPWEDEHKKLRKYRPDLTSGMGTSINFKLMLQTARKAVGPIRSRSAGSPGTAGGGAESVALRAAYEGGKETRAFASKLQQMQCHIDIEQRESKMRIK
jgi:hypothetical protein